MKTHFFAGPPPISGLSQPSCTIFMKAVEFLMKFKAIQVSSARSGGGGREVWQLPKCWWQAPARTSAGLREQTEATPDAKRAKPLARNAKLRPGRVLRPKCCLRTKSLQAGKALGVSQLGTAGCGGNNVLVYGQRGDAFLPCFPYTSTPFFSQTLVYVRAICFTCGMFLSPTVISVSFL